jgi:hypothetical protein
MSMSFALNIPTDIPWRRLCVTEDMLDPNACDASLPPRWKSSIAVYRYDPAEEYQPYEDRRVSYLKVAVTIVPWAPELGDDLLRRYVPPRLVDSLQEAFPCYGALLHVTVTPPNAPGTRDLSRYPYIADCEPKKREMYEMVTDTGEVLSGSSTSVAVGKSAVSTNTTENYNLDTGWNFGLQASYTTPRGGGGGSVGAGGTGQWGSTNRAGLENTNLRTAETSTERRELQSHVTQLAQMYNLFQAFHIGTNRAMFFLEPRPHIRQTEATFINGPRALEGLQEVFLTIVHPKDEDYCPGVVLETAHLTKTPVYESETRDDLFTDFRLTATAENRDTDWGQTDFTSEPVPLSRDYHAPAGWEIFGYDVTVLPESRRVLSGPIVAFTPYTLTVTGAVTWRFFEGDFTVPSGFADHYQNGVLNVNVTVHLRKTDQTLREYVRSLFIGARQLCCCERIGLRVRDSIVYENAVQGIGRVAVSAGRSNQETYIQSRVLANHIRTEMERSGTSRRRVPLGTMAYEESDAFLTRVADTLAAHRVTRELHKPLDQSTVADGALKVEVQRAFGEQISLAQVLTTDATILGATLGITQEEARNVKHQILQSITTELDRRRAWPGAKDRTNDERPGRLESRGDTAE